MVGDFKDGSVSTGLVSGNVVVVGSANIDMVVEVDRRPGGGETLIGSDLHFFAGGKGANQAAAAALAGARTRFVAQVGNDSNAQFLREQLSRSGVDLSGVRAVERPTGTAMIILTPDGENSIVVSPGANSTLEAVSEIWTQTDVIVVGLEIPKDTARHVAIHAAAAGARVVFNAAPAVALDRETLAACDPLIVNEYEARIVLGGVVSENFEQLAVQLKERGACSVVITLGRAGAVIADKDGVEVVPAYRVEAVDTTGAGDAFVGAVACELSRGASVRDSVRFATAMSALAVQNKGAQSSYRSRDEVEAFMALKGNPDQ